MLVTRFSLQQLSRHQQQWWRSLSTATATTNATTKLTTIDIDSNTAIATLTLNRPPANALSLELMQQVKQSVQEIEQQKCRGIILTSSSDRIFCAGLDLNECYKPDLERLPKFWCSLQNMWRAFFATAIPTVALINGHAIAGGCLLSIACDYRVMLPNFAIGLNETRVGIAVPKWVIDSYMNVINSRRRAEADLIAGTIYSNAEQALQVGLIDAVVSSKEEGLKAAMKFLTGFDKRTWRASALTKQQFRAEILADFEMDRQRDLELFLQGIQQPEVQVFLGEYLQALKRKTVKNDQQK